MDFVSAYQHSRAGQGKGVSFENLPSEKRERVVDAAMRVFAAHGYRKASVSDIARHGGISKAMVFTYFGSKLGCYAYMCDEMVRISFCEFEKMKERIFKVTDYFDRVILSSRIKIDIIKECPALLAFAVSMYQERDTQVQQIKKITLEQAYKARDLFMTTDIDAAKFKNPADTEQATKILTWMSRGCAEEWAEIRHDPDSLDRMLGEFVACVMALKKMFYKTI